jgi:hypothetical protein
MDKKEIAKDAYERGKNLEDRPTSGTSFEGGLLGAIIGTVLAPGVGTVMGAALGSTHNYSEDEQRVADIAYNSGVRDANRELVKEARKS